MVKRDFIRNIILVLIAILAIFLLRIFVFSTFKVHEDAANSYLSNGDVVVVNTRKMVFFTLVVLSQQLDKV